VHDIKIDPLAGFHDGFMTRYRIAVSRARDRAGIAFALGNYRRSVAIQPGIGQIVSEAARSDCGKKPKNNQKNQKNQKPHKHHSDEMVGCGFGVPSGWAWHAEGRSEYLEMIFVSMPRSACS
jgi:hypothetical protein